MVEIVEELLVVLEIAIELRVEFVMLVVEENKVVEVLDKLEEESVVVDIEEEVVEVGLLEEELVTVVDVPILFVVDEVLSAKEVPDTTNAVLIRHAIAKRRNSLAKRPLGGF